VQAASPCEYDALTLQQKVEVFEMALEHTTGQDLYRVLWLKSQDSEAWLNRRTNYTRRYSTVFNSEYILVGTTAIAFTVRHLMLSALKVLTT
jgi:hypothetical protein